MFIWLFQKYLIILPFKPFHSNLLHHSKLSKIQTYRVVEHFIKKQYKPKPNKPIMKTKKRIVLMCMLLAFGTNALYAQIHQSVNASGGDASGSGGSASYSVGQVVYTTPVGTNGSVAQGVQQPYEISIVLALEETQDINLVATVFPNPANEFISLQISSRSTTGLSYQFYDVNARLIESKNIESDVTKIDMQGLAAATYFLKVLDKQKEIKTFKIIKNK
jgi:hypothetical protein